MRVSSREAAQWLHRLDTYTNAEFGRARALAAIQDVCVTCGGRVTSPNVDGLCRPCAAQRQPETTDLALRRPRRIAAEAWLSCNSYRVTSTFSYRSR